MREPTARRHSDDAVDAWYYDLGEMARRVDENARKHDRQNRRLWIITLFVLVAALTLSYRGEVAQRDTNRNNHQISKNTDRLFDIQHKSCLSGLEILKKFTAQQDALIAIERTNRFVDAPTRAARIKAYTAVRIDPLPVCNPVR